MNAPTKTHERAMNATYTRAYRKAWSKVGFIPKQIYIHKLDKPLLTAYADILKFERLIDMIKEDDVEATDFAASRNKKKPPSYAVIKDVIDKVEGVDTSLAREARAMVTALDTYTKKAESYGRLAAEDELNDKAFALSICYTNLAYSAFMYAKACVMLQDQKSPKEG